MRKRTVRIEQIMTPHVETIASQAPVRDAAEIMRRLDVGALPVQDDGNLKGMLTDRDIAVRLVAEGKDPSGTRVEEVMTSQVFTCSPQDDVRKVELEMERNKVRRIIVVDQQNRAAGIVSLGDIAVHLGKQEGGEVLEKVSEPVHSRMRT